MTQQPSSLQIDGELFTKSAQPVITGIAAERMRKEKEQGKPKGGGA